MFCEYNSDNGEHECGKVKTTPQAIHDLIVEKGPQRVVLEVCHTAGWVVDIARALGKETETANTTHHLGCPLGRCLALEERQKEK